VLHSLIGYADRPTVLQIVVWVLYVVVSMTIFILLGRDRRPPRATHVAAPSAATKTRNLPT